MTSTYDFAESIATPPPGSDLDDDQIRNMLASASADSSRVYHSKENSVDTASSDARTSFDHSRKHNKDCDGGGEIDFKIQGLLHSAVQEHDHIRKEAVQKFIHQFETHPNKEALQADLKQNSAFNPFSDQSQEMIYSMVNMEYLKICEITPKHTMLQLYDILAERYCILHMRNMLETFRQSSKTKQRPLWCSVNSQLRHQERPILRCASREHREANNLPCGPSLF